MKIKSNYTSNVIHKLEQIDSSEVIL